MSTSVETAAGRLIVPCPPAGLSGPVAHRAPPFCHTTIPSRPRCRPFLILIATEPAIIAHCAQNVSFATNNEKGPGRTKRSGKAGRGAGNALRPPHYGPFFPIFPILSNLERMGKDGRAWSAKDSAYLWSEKTNSRPPPRALRTEMEPPWKRTALRTMERPRPVPPPSRVRPSVTR